MADEQSRYHKLEKPVCKSNIPPHLMAKLDEKDRWLLEMVSKLDSKTDWLMDRALENNQANIDMDVRISAVERWKSAISGRWGVIAGAGLIIFSAIVSSGASKIVEHLWTHVPKP